MSRPLKAQCPTCRREVAWTPESRWRPFCSERCRLIDLGAWFEERHAIPGETLPAAADESEPEERSG